MASQRREAFVGLIAPIGIDLDAVMIALRKALRVVSYKVNEVRLTDIFRENPHWYDVKFNTEEEKYQKYIAAGDALCEDSGRKDVLALYGIAKLQKYAPRNEQLSSYQDVVTFSDNLSELKKSKV